jgi:hypothetical protein
MRSVAPLVHLPSSAVLSAPLFPQLVGFFVSFSKAISSNVFSLGSDRLIAPSNRIGFAFVTAQTASAIAGLAAPEFAHQGDLVFQLWGRM